MEQAFGSSSPSWLPVELKEAALSPGILSRSVSVLEFPRTRVLPKARGSGLKTKGVETKHAQGWMQSQTPCLLHAREASREGPGVRGEWGPWPQ